MKPQQVKSFAGYSVRNRGRSIGIAPDHTPPTITSANAANVTSGVALDLPLSANEPVTWSLIGGTDQSSFAITGGSTLHMDAKDFAAPTDLDTNNVYNVIIRATDTAGNHTDQTFNATVVAAG